jgi:predicted phosphodiesterase
LGRKLPDRWWQDRDLIQQEWEAHDRNLAAAARAHNVNAHTVQVWWSQRHYLPKLKNGPVAQPAHDSTREDTNDDQWCLDVLKKLRNDATVEEIADAADVSPKRVREALERLGKSGYRVAEEEDRVVLNRVAPDIINVHTGLFKGDTLRVGIVSDTHLGSKHEALEELHTAYELFKSEGITEVFHAGDLVTGRGIFRGQDSEIKVVTLDDQIDYAVTNYPVVEGITTHIIAGNHDVEGEAGRVGLDPVAAVAYRREDFNYLGPFSAWVELGGAWIHLLHGKGGMSYSYSYKAQRLVDGYPSGKKPAVLIPGHWHVRGNVRHRDVEVLWPGCFEWQSMFLARLGLHPAVGFHVLELTIAEDGSVVKWLPTWFPYYAGRELAA